MPKLEFLCGCISGEVVNRENIFTMDSVVFDEEGMLTCAIHHQRRKGWRTVPVLRITDENGVVRETDMNDASYYKYSPQQIEAFIVFDEAIIEDANYLGLDTKKPDVRDTRDPQMVGSTWLSRHEGYRK